MAAAVAPSRSCSQSSLEDADDLAVLLQEVDAGSAQGSKVKRTGPLGPQRSSVVGCSMGSLIDDGEAARNKFFEEITFQGTKRLRGLPHVNARTSPYTRSDVHRMKVPDDQLSWEAETDAPYDPPHYDAPSVLQSPPWADPVSPAGLVFNAVDAVHQIDRTSYEGEYAIDPVRKLPLNPRGRTGLRGRGLLGRYGPNHAADPVITRWMRDDCGAMLLTPAGLPRLEFVAIKRNDTGEWAIPGGMVDPGENISATLKREFGEETMASLELPSDQLDELKENLDRVLKDGVVVYRGYVDDHRNTDNAWMETTCVNFHDETGASTRPFKLAAGDDAGDVAWTPFYEEMPLYATHTVFLSLINEMRVSWSLNQLSQRD
eukprot:m.238780 g.238780  ORF g.238780 m.238780 type:complete len:374 (-) comp15810_c0_seq2:117-1238(-)